MKCSVFTRVVATVALIVVLIGMPLRVSAVPTTYELSFPEVQQQASNWCWAACCSAIIQYYGGNISQAQIVTSVYGNTYDLPGNMNQMQQVLARSSVSSEKVNGAMSFVQLRTNTYTYRRPVVVGLVFADINNDGQSNDGGHVVVAVGYTSEIGTDEKYVAYMDPGDGDIHTMAYSELVGCAWWTWEESLKNIRES